MTLRTRLGVIGAGWTGTRHIMAYQRVPQVDVVAVCDPMPGRAQNVADEFDIPQFFEDHRHLLVLEDIEAVSVCTPNQAHRAPTVDALQAGKHVLVEKPLAATLDDALAMIAAARENGTILHTGFWQRWQPDIQTAKRIVESGTLGELYYAQMITGGRRRIPKGSFIRRKTAGAGAVVDLGCYALDTLLFLTGNPRPISVTATVSHRLGQTLPNVPGDLKHDPQQVEVEDFGAAFVRFENGLALNLIAYWAAHADNLGPSVLLGTRGGLQLTPQLILFRDEFGALTNVVPQIPDPTESTRMFRFVPQAQRFVDAVRAGGPSPVDLEGVLLGQLILDGIFRSAATGREITIEVPAL